MLQIKLNIQKLALVGFIISGLAGCSAFEVASIRNRPWPRTADAKMRDIGIGYFSYSGPGNPKNAQEKLYDTINFALREAGYITRENHDMKLILARAGLADNRLLARGELIQLSSQFGGKLLMQAKYKERIAEDGLEDYMQANLHVFVYDMDTGARISEVIILGRKLEHVEGSRPLEMARLLTRELEKLIVERKNKIPDPQTGKK